MKSNYEEVLPKLVNLEIFKEFKENTEINNRIMKMVYEALDSADFNAGEIIIKEDDIGDAFYILIKGNIQIFRNTPSGDSIALANLNDSMNIFFGEAALIGNDKRSATVKAASECHTLKLSSKKFFDICNAEPLFGYKVLLCLAGRLKNSVAKANKDIATLYEALFREIEGSN